MEEVLKPHTAMPQQDLVTPPKIVPPHFSTYPPGPGCVTSFTHSAGGPGGGDAVNSGDGGGEGLVAPATQLNVVQKFTLSMKNWG